MQCWPSEFRGTAKHREALWRAELALKSDAAGEFRIAFIVAAAEARILAPVVPELEPTTAIDDPDELAAE